MFHVAYFKIIQFIDGGRKLLDDGQHVALRRDGLAQLLVDLGREIRQDGIDVARVVLSKRVNTL